MISPLSEDRLLEPGTWVRIRSTTHVGLKGGFGKVIFCDLDGWAEVEAFWPMTHTDKTFLSYGKIREHITCMERVTPLEAIALEAAEAE